MAGIGPLKPAGGRSNLGNQPKSPVQRAQFTPKDWATLVVDPVNGPGGAQVPNVTPQGIAAGLVSPNSFKPRAER